MKNASLSLPRAVPLTNDPALIESSIITVQALTLGLRAAHTAISRYDREIARTFAQHPDASLFAALPGSGTAYSARLLAAFGSRRELFQSAQAMLNFSGIAPVLKRSGQTTIIHRRYARPLFLHQSFIEYANESIRHSLWARAFYQKQQAREQKSLGYYPRPGLQMDPHPLSLLAGTHPLRRTPLPQVTAKKPLTIAAILQPTTQPE